MAIEYSSQLGLTAVGSIYVSVGLVANVTTQQQWLEQGEDIWAARLIELTGSGSHFAHPENGTGIQYKQGLQSLSSVSGRKEVAGKSTHTRALM